ncbi:hypothetical protein SLEP1_g1608 [Rubroshorea leprosula]|uniref:Two-component response regulator n=1 Tax=Rubroshorea leprosula TaxID=152421 RepID=A0AAV5HNG2_9ROSI|nr:hypothetical protein SLEP1_g1608 [Rubroshorea leprosula]
MTVEDRRGGSDGEDGGRDLFPVGMRVLAVDDDRTCLKVLVNLLRKCQYQVTSTTQAITALEMLRENKNKFDLVISDVNMPDMDGFKLLELVGLEMDLPVIMLSVHSDTELVMKGITHGAVDYLLKPARFEELKNIWQHVVRRKKFESKSSNQDKAQGTTGEAGQGATSTGSADHGGKVSKKRKDQSEGEEEEGEDNGNESEDPSTQKKPRVVWSVELHRKFVAAVNQLGLDKAVPKKILDLMNVEGLTRENVASHLQKYRLYLKRLSSVATQQANLVAAFGSKDPSYLHMGSMDGFGDFRTLSGPGSLSSTSLSSYQPGGMLGRLNSPTALSLHGIAASGMIQQGHSQSLSTSAYTLGKIQPTIYPANQNQNTNLLQGIPTSLELNQLSQIKSPTQIGDFNHVNDPAFFGVASRFPDARVTICGSSNSVSTASGNGMLLQANPHQTQSRGAFGNKPSLAVASQSQDSFNMDVQGSNFIDSNRCNHNWQGAVQLSKLPSSSLPISEAFGHEQLSCNNLQANFSWSSSQMGNNTSDLASSMAITASLEDSRGDMQCQNGMNSDVIQKMNYPAKQQWEEHGYNQNLNRSFGGVNSLVSSSGVVMDQSGAVGSKRADDSLFGQLNRVAPYVAGHTKGERSTYDSKLRSNEDILLEQMKSQNSFIQNNYDSLDDIMSAMIKPGQNNQTALMDGEYWV